MVTLYAQLYDCDAVGFYFKSATEYDALRRGALNAYGAPVEEFEIQFIDGEALDAALAGAWGLNQVNFEAFFEAVADWDDARKRLYVIAVGECGYDHDDFVDDPHGVDIDVYHEDSLRELAEQFVDEGLFGEIPERLAFYIDYDAIARDLAVEYSETVIAGMSLVYRCG